MALFCVAWSSLNAADTLVWNTNQDRVSADIKASGLLPILEQIAAVTGWHVLVEPETLHIVSAKFKDLPPGEALHLLLGDVNFALLPGTNSSQRLFVFRTTMSRATQMVRAARADPVAQAKIFPNELVVRLKPGARIEDLAKLLGAKVVGRIDGLNAYRLKFEDAAATDAARAQLASNSDVASVDNNFEIDRPQTPTLAGTTSGSPPHLQLKPPADNGRVIVGLVDMAVQPLGNGLDSFLLKQISVAGDANLDPSTPSHGTSMAETVLRSIENITKGSTSVQILPVDVYGSNPTTSTFDVANGIVQAVNGGAKIINLSLGSPADSQFLHDVILDVSKQNIPMFAAAGNQPVTTAFYPAAYPEVGGVTAIDQGQLAPYANRGSFITLGAPGTSIVYFNGQSYYVTGTSSSSAFTSGMAAGFMDANHADVQKMQAFIKNNFGVTITPAK